MWMLSCSDTHCMAFWKASRFWGALAHSPQALQRAIYLAGSPSGFLRMKWTWVKATVAGDFVETRWDKMCVCVSALYHMINWNYYIYIIYITSRQLIAFMLLLMLLFDLNSCITPSTNPLRHRAPTVRTSDCCTIGIPTSWWEIPEWEIASQIR